MRSLLLTFCCLISHVEARDYEVLMIGNSYIAQTWSQLNGFFGADAEHSISITRVTPGGTQLATHAETASTQNLISTGGPWDVVVLQDQSQTPAYAALSQGWWDTFYTVGALPLSNLATAAGAKVLFFQTWARAAGDTATLQYFNNDPLVMQNALTSSYGEAAELLNAAVAPVGEAWEDALIANPSLALHSSDRSHPNANGAFLTGAVLYEAITGKDARDLSYTGSLSAANATFLKSIAHYVNFKDWIAGFSGLSSTDPAADGDGDGLSNEREWLADTDPSDDAIHFELGVDQSASGVRLVFPAASSRLFLLESRASADAEWEVMEQMLGNGAMYEMLLPSGGATAWYRVGARRPGL